MFFYDGVKSNMSCALKVDTSGKGWYETTSKILRKIKGVSYNLDTKEGMIYISGKVDPQKILRMIAKHEKKVELCWMKTGEQYGTGNNHVMDHSMPMSSYTPYHRGYWPPTSMPYYEHQYHNYEPISAPHPHCYPPQLPHYY